MSEKKVAIARGFCKTCRWSRELGEKAKKPPFVLDCQALPWVWDVQQAKSALATVKGEAQTVVDVRYLPRIHREDDFCMFFEPMPTPEELEAAEYKGGLIYGAPMPPPCVPDKPAGK